MPMDFPDMESLKKWAKVRGFRQPFSDESELAYRAAFSLFMKDKDPIEAMEIASGKGWDKWKVGTFGG